jgi:hypothetical protein
MFVLYLGPLSTNTLQVGCECTVTKQKLNKNLRRMRVCVCMYVRTYVRKYVCMYVCMYVYKCVCMYTCVMYICMHVCMYINVCVCMYVKRLFKLDATLVETLCGTLCDSSPVQPSVWWTKLRQSYGLRIKAFVYFSVTLLLYVALTTKWILLPRFLFAFPFRTQYYYVTCRYVCLK